MLAVQVRSLRPQVYFSLASCFILLSALFGKVILATPLTSLKRDSPRLLLELGPAPAPEDGPPLSAGALRDPAYLPYQIAGIAGAYGLSLVLVAILLLVLSKKRRNALAAGVDELEYDQEPEPVKRLPNLTIVPPTSPRSIPRSPVRNFSYPSPDRAEFHPSPLTPYINPSPVSTIRAPGVDLAVDQKVVAMDREMAQAQLEEMYKYVMEQEEAKKHGIVLQAPVTSRPSSSNQSSIMSKKEKTKPAHLNLARDSEKTQSRTSSILSALRSPRKKSGVKGISISSPLMTPKSGTFPKPDAQEMNAIPPRQYAPAPPPPIPTDQVPYGREQQSQQMQNGHPDHSPESTLSIDERIGGQLPTSHGQVAQPHRRNISAAPTEQDPWSAASDHSQTPLVGLPSSPKPSVTRFPTLPSSPKPGATFRRANAPSAVRTGGTLPLRAYEPAVNSPSTASHITTRQTTFERTGPISPMSARTPGTGMAVPYTPYQPFTPCVPVTPSLVTKAERKRMRRLEPKTPTLEMVKSEEDIW